MVYLNIQETVLQLCSLNLGALILGCAIRMESPRLSNDLTLSGNGVGIGRSSVGE
jgi:hypothetical protein